MDAELRSTVERMAAAIKAGPEEDRICRLCHETMSDCHPESEPTALCHDCAHECVAQIPALIAYIASAEAGRDAAERREKALREALLAVEFVYSLPDGEEKCPECGEMRDEGHLTRCMLANVLALATPSGNGLPESGDAAAAAGKDGGR